MMLAAVFSLGTGAGFAGGGDSQAQNSLFTEFPGAVCQASVQHAPAIAARTARLSAPIPAIIPPPQGCSRLTGSVAAKLTVEFGTVVQ
jgi:hypothetical protein